MTDQTQYNPYSPPAAEEANAPLHRQLKGYLLAGILGGAFAALTAGGNEPESYSLKGRTALAISVAGLSALILFAYNLIDKNKDNTR